MSKGMLIIIMIVIFVIMTIISALVTYRIRKIRFEKLNEIFDNSEDDIKN